MAAVPVRLRCWFRLNAMRRLHHARLRACGPRASVRTARADTIAHPLVLSAARYRCRTCPRGDSEAGAPASSIRRPTIRSARLPRRHTPNRLADVGSCSRRKAIACAGKSRSGRARHCGANVAANRRSRGRKRKIQASWAWGRNHVRSGARFPDMEPPDWHLRHIPRKYRVFQVVLQHRWYGRCEFARLPF